MKKFLFVFVISFYTFLSPDAVKAQSRDSALLETAEQKHVDSLAKEMDIVDFANSILRSHIKSKPDTLKLKPGKLFFALVPAIGYTLEGSWLANVAFNTSFYASNPDSTNLSTFNYGIQYDLNHQIIAPVISNIWFKKNTLDLLGDWRYYLYPSFIYGLGGNTSASNADLVNFSYIRLYQEALGHFNSYYYFGGGFNYDDHFNILEDGKNLNFESYNAENKNTKQTVSSGPILHFMYDSRANPNNPRDALYGSISYRYNPTFLGSSQPWAITFIEMKKYIQLSRRSPNTLCLWSWNVFTLAGNPPYFDLPSNGWDIYSNSGRGYIQGRFRGQNMLYDEAEYRFKITHNGLLGGVVFANAESVSEYPSNKFVYLDPGEGFGLRIKMNKYSDVNLCVDYGFGLYGSRGFFFNLGEVF